MAYGTVAADVISNSVAGSSIGAGNASIMKNRIINGAMVISQRNGTSTVTPANGDFIVDRFSYVTTQSSKVTAAQSSTAPAGFTKSLLFTSSSAYSAAAGDLIAFSQAIEGFNIADLGWGTASAKTVTLSFQVYSSLTGTFGGCFRNDAGNRFYVFSYSIPVANTWTTISITVAGDTTGTWATDNSAGIRLYFNLGSGTTYSGTAGSWGATAYYNATGSVNLVGTSGATFYITGVQLEVGSSATGFEYVNYQTSLANCQRYYTQFSNATLSDNLCAYTPYSPASYTSLPNSSAILPMYFPVSMRSAPTVVGVPYNGSINRQTSTTNVAVFQWASTSSSTTYGVSSYTATAEL